MTHGITEDFCFDLSIHWCFASLLVELLHGAPAPPVWDVIGERLATYTRAEVRAYQASARPDGKRCKTGGRVS